MKLIITGDLPRVGDFQRWQQQRDSARALLRAVQPSAGPELLHLNPGSRKRHRVRGQVHFPSHKYVDYLIVFNITTYLLNNNCLLYYETPNSRGFLLNFVINIFKVWNNFCNVAFWAVVNLSIIIIFLLNKSN